MKQKINVLIADDNQLFRSVLANFLNQTDDIHVKGVASDGLEVFKLLEMDPFYNLILLDFNMPNLNGAETVSRLKKRGFDIPVLMLSMEGNELYIIRLIRMGIKGYLLKDQSPQKLLDAIRTSQTNNLFLFDNSSLRFENLIIEDNELFDKMTAKELEFLRLTTSDFTYRQIAAEMGVDYKTIENYRELLFIKLQVKSRIGLAYFAVKRGLVF
jgi:two-component system invasion response regulator UvrY